MKTRKIELLVGLALLALAACGETASRQAVQATVEMGADGGTVSLGALSVEVPAGTFGTETTLSVRFAADHPEGNIGFAYEVDAGGAKLLAPATISYKVDSADLPEGTTLADMRLAFVADGAWQPLPACDVDTATGVVRCETTHFSIWGAVPPLPPIPCSAAADCPEMECMVASCDGGGCAYAADPACPCTPDCAGKECGDDGCGGSCGECDDGCGQAVCELGECLSLCLCNCEDKECGEDGCGGTCGECAKGYDCSDGVCTCTPSCGGKECGDDGCGGICGDCAQYTTCQAGLCEPEPGGPFSPCENNSDCGSGWCVETDEGDMCTMLCIEDCPNGWVCEPVSAGPDLVYMCLPATCQPGCEGKECGDDGCGGSCGECAVGLSCNAGVCVAGQSCNVWDYITPEELDAVGQCFMVDVFYGYSSEPLFPALYGEGHLFKEDLALDGELVLAETSTDSTWIKLTAPCSFGLEIVIWSNVGPGGLEEGWPNPVTDPSCLSTDSCDCDVCVFAQASLAGKPTLDAIAGTVLFGCDSKNCDCGVMSYSVRLADLEFADIAGEKQFLNIYSDGKDWLPKDEWLGAVSSE